MQTDELRIYGLELVFTPSTTAAGDAEHWHRLDTLAGTDG